MKFEYLCVCITYQLEFALAFVGRETSIFKK
jgi:hypothetical protein